MRDSLPMNILQPRNQLREVEVRKVRLHPYIWRDLVEQVTTSCHFENDVDARQVPPSLLSLDASLFYAEELKDMRVVEDGVDLHLLLQSSTIGSWLAQQRDDLDRGDAVRWVRGVDASKDP